MHILESDETCRPRLSKRSLPRRAMTGLEEYEEAKAGPGKAWGPIGGPSSCGKLEMLRRYGYVMPW